MLYMNLEKQTARTDPLPAGRGLPGALLLGAMVMVSVCVAFAGEAAGKRLVEVMPPAEAFIARWERSEGMENATSQTFVNELCDLLMVDRPHPARARNRDNRYVFEKRVTFVSPNGRRSQGRIDVYKRGHFVIESKQGTFPLTPEQRKETDRSRGTAVRFTPGWDEKTIAAREQGLGYIKALPPEDGRPPFLMVLDVAFVLEVYADFAQSGIYTPFPNPREHRIYLKDLAKPEVQERLYQIWTDPLSLNPAIATERATNDIAELLARLAASLEQSGYDREIVSKFMMRCILSMYAEDVELLPRNSFTLLLARLRDVAASNLSGEKNSFLSTIEMTDLWKDMYTGGYSDVIQADLMQFGGPLLGAEAVALPLTFEQFEFLFEAAKAEWSLVESSIFGTLLERALSAQERHKMGTHYTPSAYVERLVAPTVMEPLTLEWQVARDRALDHIRSGDRDAARQTARDFHMQLCKTIILDPAAGSGNFLFTSLKMVKALEGEVLTALVDLGDLEYVHGEDTPTVGPHQFRGIELNHHAADIAELVLWLAYLQSHYKINGRVPPSEPIIPSDPIIERRDAILAYDVTAESRYANPRSASPWPRADFVVGNPPFAGTNRLRTLFGDEYVDALFAAYPEAPRNTDYVMRFWDRAATLAREGKVIRFGLITTNSLAQVSNNQIIDKHLNADQPLSLVYAIPDHPWVDSSGSAKVRIAMTVGEGGRKDGVLATVAKTRVVDGVVKADLATRYGRINPDLTIGPDMTKAVALKSNSRMAYTGMKPNGQGFVVSRQKAAELGLGSTPGLDRFIRPYRNGKDITGICRNHMGIDLDGLTSEEVQRHFPDVYQWLYHEVKPVREKKRDERLRRDWWIFDSPRRDLRKVLKGLNRYIVTVATAKRPQFVFLDADIIPDNRLIVIPLSDAYYLGILSSNIHAVWASATGGSLGEGRVYNKTLSFDGFPFPAPGDEENVDRIRNTATRIDLHRKDRQTQYPKLTLTDMYNVLELLRAGGELSTKDTVINEQGDVETLLILHENLDAAVAEAYGWPNDLSDDEIIQLLYDLNQRRAEEEATGQVRWLKPEITGTITEQ